jgi:hypothetical protein
LALQILLLIRFELIHFLLFTMRPSSSLHLMSLLATLLTLSSLPPCDAQGINTTISPSPSPQPNPWPSPTSNQTTGSSNNSIRTTTYIVVFTVGLFLAFPFILMVLQMLCCLVGRSDDDEHNEDQTNRDPTIIATLFLAFRWILVIVGSIALIFVAPFFMPGYSGVIMISSIAGCFILLQVIALGLIFCVLKIIRWIFRSICIQPRSDAVDGNAVDGEVVEASGSNTTTAAVPAAAAATLAAAVATTARRETTIRITFAREGHTYTVFRGIPDHVFQSWPTREQGVESTSPTGREQEPQVPNWGSALWGSLMALVYPASPSPTQPPTPATPPIRSPSATDIESREPNPEQPPSPTSQSLRQGALSTMNSLAQIANNVNPTRRIVKILTRGDELVCTICLDSFSQGDKITTVPCHGRHDFHTACLAEWTKSHVTCPNCRGVLLFD